MDGYQSDEDTVQIGEYAFYRLYRAEDERLTRDLERRRVAAERLDEQPDPGRSRVTLFQRLAGRFRIAGQPPLHSSQ